MSSPAERTTRGPALGAALGALAAAWGLARGAAPLDDNSFFTRDIHQKNYKIAHHILHAFFSQPAPVYRG